MNRIRVDRKPAPRLLYGVTAATALAISLAPCARAEPPPAAEPQAWPEAETVRMLLRAEAAAALADCSVPGRCPAGADQTPAAPAAAPAVRADDDIRVLAIYGTARRLRVDLDVNGAVLRYQAGRGAPVAGAAVAGAYRLLAIEDACVRLRRDGLERTACLDLGRSLP